MLAAGGSAESVAEPGAVGLDPDRQRQSGGGQVQQTVGRFARIHARSGRDVGERGSAEVGDHGEQSCVGGIGDGHGVQPTGVRPPG
ncbi:hypothetical protein ACZ91_15265 [Streptomyces regensis]|nr:hypothetical protein ACZ91_15265 [Streptomyces regensis]